MNICRTCGQFDEKVSGVTISNYIVDNGHTIKISDLLYRLTSLEFLDNINYPKKICTKCMEHIIRTLWFVNKCKQTNEIFIKEIKDNEKLKNDESSQEDKQLFLVSKCEIPDIALKDKKETLKVNINVDKGVYVTPKKNINTMNLQLNTSEKVCFVKLRCKEGVENTKLSNKMEYTVESGKEENEESSDDEFLIKTNKTRDDLNETDDISNLLTQNNESEDVKKRKDYICHICNKKLATEPSLRVHLRRHNKVYKAFCNICKKGYVTPSEYKKHMAYHTSGKNTIHLERKHECNYCQKHFRTKYNLILHVKSQHLKSERVICTVCRKSYNTKLQLRKHFMKKHFNVNKFMCRSCNEEFPTEQQMKIHIMLHEIKDMKTTL